MRPAVVIAALVSAVALLAAGCTTVRLDPAGGSEPALPLVAVFELETAGDGGEGRARSYLHLAARSWDDWMALRWPDRADLADVPVAEREGRVPAVQRFQRPRVLSGQLGPAHAAPRAAPLSAQERRAAYDGAVRLLPDRELEREYEDDSGKPPLVPHTYVPVRLDDFRSGGATVTEIGADEAASAGLDTTLATAFPDLAGRRVAYHVIEWSGPGGREQHVAVALDRVTAVPIQVVETDRDPHGEVVSELRLLALALAVADAELGLPDVTGG